MNRLMRTGVVARCAAAVLAVCATGTSVFGVTGVCCQAGFLCTIGDRNSCAAVGGEYQGDGTTCVPANPCQLVLGACCVVEAIVRAGAGGTSPASPPWCDKCPPKKDDCRGCKNKMEMVGLAPVPTIDFQNFRSVCVIATTDACRFRNGVYQGDGTVCNPNPCPVPPPVVGACCLLDSAQQVFCRQDTEAGCATNFGAFTSLGTACGPSVCAQPGVGACCRVSSGYLYCTTSSQAACLRGQGIYQGNATACAPTTCPQPVSGACCTAATATRGSFCVLSTSYQCGAPSVFTAGATCSTAMCARSCPCDWNRDGYLNGLDIGQFLTDWLAGNGDFDGSGATDVQDYTAFVSCYTGTNPACIRP